MNSTNNDESDQEMTVTVVSPPATLANVHFSSSMVTSLPTISTAVPFSARFQDLQQFPQNQVLAGGVGDGLIVPQTVSPSVVSCLQPQQNAGKASSFSRNVALAKDLHRRTEDWILRNKLLGALAGSHIGWMPQKYNEEAVRLARGETSGGIVVKTTGLSGGFHGRIQKNRLSGPISEQKTGKVVARGGGPLYGKGLGSYSGTNSRSRGIGKNRRACEQRKTKDQLDAELDAYMSKSKAKAKMDLDKELDEYMKAAQSQSTVSSTKVPASNLEEISDDDVPML